MSARGLLTALVVALVSPAVGCGSPATPREVAETYVEALESEDWKAACEVSAHDGLDECAELHRRAYGDADAVTPTVQQIEAVVEEVDGRNLVQLEITVIR